MPPDAFTFDTSGQLVMQTAIGGRGTLFGPLVGAAVWLFLQDFLQAALGLGAAWKLVLGVVFVLLVCFLRRGIIGGLEDLYGRMTGKRAKHAEPERIRRRCRRADAAKAMDSARRRDSRRRRRLARVRPYRPDPAGHRPDQALRRPGRQQRYRFHGQSRRAARHHRPQRRRQIDLLQDADLRDSADLGHDHVRGARYHRHQRHRRLPARPDQELSGQPAVHRTDGARECRDRGAGQIARQIPARSVPQPRQHPGIERAGEAHARTRQSRRRGPTRRYRNSLTARSAGWKSDWRWRHRRACCCWTSRWPA